MANKAIILLNDTTDYGGKVITAVGGYTYKGIPVAGERDLVECSKCKDVFPIMEGSDNLENKGKSIAVESMHTTCGTKLIASQENHFYLTPLY
ncbi:PAAR domain-containing protein [Xenorhabdus bovienii]|uniref:PAAR domain-containing protein n=1 Tax=Xenorhabdus bovienii TaxID=40576 RepID=UPI00237C9765|nr:PAAR domain-containing protein [Xenorhabdus bovienii]MDE1483448.1 PAAR domain-containing protein [Xenorhabdus bovienii]MDE9431978.1 PAAR domain-containing protein [Xenorhabdus bovienii]MDE9442511.1 PAAR domain-containing protein [Xenorhabdus bovienii]MDE9489704.1 PAAR domain-containing protein [Xenorhabdus bovienii]MDE9505978.1 PAAR domain-containing protein [Xenorhabdus bovienii]